MGESSGFSSMDGVILATGGYDHTIKIWQAASGICTRTMQHADSVSFITSFKISACDLSPLKLVKTKLLSTNYK